MKQKIPKIDTLFERILAIGPHPDDIELGCFGTLARFSKAGSQLAFVVLTAGGVGGETKTRKAEASASAKMLGAKLYMADLPDTQISEGQPTIRIIEEAIKEFKPTVVLVNSANDTHQDHRNAAKAAISASRFVPMVLFYQTPSSTRFFNPQIFIEINKFIDQKMEAVKLHKSQGENVYMADRAVKGLAEFLGLQIYQGGKYYEGFEIHQLIINSI
jgi:LmbE family N-acetylglucosaminyl deacetylase